MKIEDLALFVRVTEHMSFSEAASEFDLPQSSVSRKIKQIEDDLKVRLFERTSRKIYLTEQGEHFYKHSKVIVDEFNYTTEIIAEHQQEPEGTLTVCMLPFMAELLTKEFFYIFMQKYKNINLVYKALHPGDIELSCESDLMLYLYPPKDLNMIARRVLSFPRRYYASPEYLKKHGRPKHPAELSEHNCLLFDSKLKPANEWSYIEDETMKMVKVKGSFTSDAVDLTLKLAIKGQGICWAPQFIANEAVRSGNLICLFDGRYAVEQPFYVIYHSRRHMPKKIKVFIDMFIQYMQQTATIFN